LFFRVGDYILSINSTELTGLPDHKVQQILRLLPRGLAKLVVSVTPPDIAKLGSLSPFLVGLVKSFVSVILNKAGITKIGDFLPS